MSQYNPTKQDYAARRAARERERVVHDRRGPLRRGLERWLRGLAILLCRPFAHVFSYLWRITFGRWLFIKVTGSHSAAQTEVATTRFVATHTSIPVPRPLGCFRWRGASYIVMTRVRGVELEKVWEHLSDDAKDTIIDQLAPFTAQLRELKTPYGSMICSVLQGPVHDMRLPSKHRGPFNDEDAMNRVLRGFQDIDKLPPHIAEAQARTHPIVFTHGDLAPRNVMVEGTTVTGIIDWGAAGWFPAHWEYRKARWAVFDSLATAWTPYIPRFTPAYEMEADADDYLDGQFWYPS